MVYSSISGSDWTSSSSSSSSSVELHAEKALLMGGRTGGICMDRGTSMARRIDFRGESGGDWAGKENSGHDCGDKLVRKSCSDWYVGMDLSCALINWARCAE